MDFDEIIIKILFGLLATIIGVVVLVFIGDTVNSFRYDYMIKSGRTLSNSSFTNEYIEKDGCVEYLDEFDSFEKICGEYKIIEMNK